MVFTLPSELRGLAQAHRREVFDAFFTAASETLQELSMSRFGGTLGATLVLHTWTRDLRFHPHLHALITAGALSSDGQRWIRSSKKFLFPVRVLGALLRGKMLNHLRRLHRAGQLGAATDFDDAIHAAASRKSWLVYVKAPFSKVEHVLKYLGRYTHRVGISNSRLLDVTQDCIVFRTKGAKTAALTPHEFLRRFVQHVLPRSFLKIRHFGLYAAANASRKYPVARQLLTPDSTPTVSAPQPTAVSITDWREQLRLLTGRNLCVCPLCGGSMISIDVPRPVARGPPGVAS